MCQMTSEVNNIVKKLGVYVVLTKTGKYILIFFFSFEQHVPLSHIWQRF